MTVTIKSTIDRTIPSEGVYQVAVTVIDVTDIEFDVFVFKTEDATFSHVATVYDMESYPPNPITAESEGLIFYRGRTLTKQFSTVNDATGFEQVTKNRLTILATAWDSISSDFTGSVIHTASS